MSSNQPVVTPRSGSLLETAMAGFPSHRSGQRWRAACSLGLVALNSASVSALDLKGTLQREEPVIRTLALGMAAFFVCVLIWDFMVKRGERNEMLEIDRLAAAANMKQSRVSESISSDDQDLGLSPALVARTRPEASAPPPPVAAPSAPQPPAPAASGFGSPPPAFTPSPPPNFPSAPAFPGRSAPPPPPDFGSSPSPVGETSKLSFPTAPGPAPGSTSGETVGGWAELLHRVRSGDGEGGAGGPAMPPPMPKFGGSDESVDSIPRPSFPSAPTAPAASGGGDAWEALLKKTAAPSGGLNFGEGNPFSKMLSGGAAAPAATGSSNPFAKTPLPNTSDELEGPRNPLADESVATRKPNRSISLGFGSQEKPPE